MGGEEGNVSVPGTEVLKGMYLGVLIYDMHDSIFLNINSRS